ADEAPGVEEFEVARFEAEDVTPVEPVVVHQPVQSLEDELGALLNEGPVAAQAEFVAPISDQEFGSVEPLHDFQAVEAASVAIDAFEPEVVADEPTLDAAETIAFDDADFELDAGYDAPQDEVVAPDAYLASQPVVETFAEDRYEAEDPVQAQIEPVVEIEPVAADPTVLAEVSASDEIEAAIAELQSVSSWQGDASADVPPAKFDDWAATAQEDVIAGEAAVDWVEAADPAPLRPSFAPEPVVAAGPVAPAEPEPAEEELDPFAALAALAAAPPILKALGRANPVAVNRGSERDVYQRAEQRAPEPVVVRSEPVARIEPAVARERYVAPPAPVSQTPAPVVSPSPAFVAPAVAAAPEIARSAEPVYTKTYQPAAPAYQAEPVPVAASYDVATPGSEGAQTDHSAAYQAAEDQFDASELDDLLADEFATDFETVDVPDEAIAVTDELDLPDLAAPEDAPASRFDDFDADFADAFNQLSVAQPAPRPAPVNQPTAKSPAPSDDYDMLDADFAAFQSEIETNVGSLDDADDLQDVLAGDPEPAPRSRLPRRRRRALRLWFRRRSSRLKRRPRRRRAVCSSSPAPAPRRHRSPRRPPRPSPWRALPCRRAGRPASTSFRRPRSLPVPRATFSRRPARA
ncbi:MAG: hypothetical protein LCH88_12680, partial [Proteobacteria bacterium]|nr:hypothetical protein [Pseudomonadota bacterium]